MLLVDLDLRGPQLNQYFTSEDLQGIDDYLVYDVPVSNLLFNPVGVHRLVVLPGHTSMVNSAENAFFAEDGELD